ncbi:hypothetical protein PVE_R1G3240 [Pseudomonas veronii 1YdBTEX2]|jgi:gluconate kinase|uniref:Uncharacterized protein n=1 Tax=Pseudomonas veronii 1YdBTEX2 TaxID=1295141 RepID=A0A1D3JYM3_PSEVE|nr:hypothetical protein [Pseudomonas veronii]SBW81122.1 hypothetical protein PVE_R1G3240 [Pseudomonas veronii 1YdBTEX2]
MPVAYKVSRESGAIQSTLRFEKAEAESWLSSLKARLERLAQGTPLVDQQPFDWSNINDAVKKKSVTLTTEEASLVALQKDEHRQVMHQYTGLRARYIPRGSHSSSPASAVMRVMLK